MFLALSLQSSTSFTYSEAWYGFHTIIMFLARFIQGGWREDSAQQGTGWDFSTRMWELNSSIWMDQKSLLNWTKKSLSIKAEEFPWGDHTKRFCTTHIWQTKIDYRMEICPDIMERNWLFAMLDCGVAEQRSGLKMWTMSLWGHETWPRKRPRMFCFKSWRGIFERLSNGFDSPSRVWVYD